MVETSASAGGEHTLFYDSKTKSLFSAGACGLGWCRNYPLNAALFHLQKVKLGDDSKPCRLFHASYYHNLAVDATQGQLYTWGCGTFVDLAKDGTPNLDGVIPALGPRANTTTDLGEPPQPIALVPDDPHNTKDPIVSLSAGAYHSVVLTRLGIVYTFGAGQLGQLGRHITSDNTDSSGLPVDLTPAPIQGIDSAGQDKKVVAIGAGFYNTFAIVGASGSLYCAGENQNKQCGEGPRNLREMVRVKEIGDTVVESVEGGYCHTLVKTAAGKVFSLGCGEEGQRGDGRLIDEDGDDEADDTEPRETVTPVVLPEGRNAIGIAAGANHSVVLGDDGVAYTFGANDVGQCGVSSKDADGEEGAPVLSPHAVEIPKDAGQVIGISAGYAHTVLTTSKERVFVFGQNDNGQLGIGGKGTQNDGDIDREPSLRPVEVEIKQ